VSCYSQHPLVPALKDEIRKRGGKQIVTGIFESSILSCLGHLSLDERFGIVTTGNAWEKTFPRAVYEFLGAASSSRFAGMEGCGLSAIELHQTSDDEVSVRMKDATKRLVRKGKVGAICLGCAGMAGMDRMVREACVEELGEDEGGRIRVVDGVVAGVGWLEGAVRAGS